MIHSSNKGWESQLHIALSSIVDSSMGVSGYCKSCMWVCVGGAGNTVVRDLLSTFGNPSPTTCYVGVSVVHEDFSTGKGLKHYW
jgi:hypothetical protein